MRLDFIQNTENGFNICKWNDVDLSKLCKWGIDSVFTGKQQTEVLNIPIAFDIETYSGKNSDGEKFAYCYIWQMCIDGAVIVGRSLNDFSKFLDRIIEEWQLNENRNIIIYVHNLSYEFQFIRKHLNITDVFAREQRKVMKCVASGCVIFKCSYFLSGLSLQKVAENLTDFEIEKAVGLLDYRKPRNSYTPLTDDEMLYCANDVIIICAYIYEEMKKNDNDITKIPLTKTGYMRRYVREYIQQNGDYNKHRGLIKGCFPDSELFIQLHRTFAGGYTHANCRYVNEVINNVTSLDYCSSYPARLCLDKSYPYKFRKLSAVKDLSTLIKLCKKYCCLFRVYFEGVKAITSMTTLSVSKCVSRETNGVVADNGRVYSADTLATYMTETDFLTFMKYYTFERVKVADFHYSEKRRLPDTIVSAILDLFTDKTTLKGVEGKEQEYLVAKGLLNSAYGCCVTSPLNDIITYNAHTQEWAEPTPPDVGEALKDNKDRYSTFLLFQWGVWCTSLARGELLSFIADNNMYNDVVYCDTDSIKLRHFEKYEKAVNEYNQVQIDRFKAVADLLHYEIPKTRDGVLSYMGTLDNEGTVEHFKTLGAKRYLTENHGKYKMTVAGVNKIKGCEYIASQEKPFDFFGEGMTIPATHSVKLTMTYVDDSVTAEIEDEHGNVQNVVILSSIHAEPQEYHISSLADFLSWCLTMQNVNGGGHINKKQHPAVAINIIDRLGCNK